MSREYRPWTSEGKSELQYFKGLYLGERIQAESHDIIVRALVAEIVRLDTENMKLAEEHADAI